MGNLAVIDATMTLSPRLRTFVEEEVHEDLRNVFFGGDFLEALRSSGFDVNPIEHEGKTAWDVVFHGCAFRAILAKPVDGVYNVEGQLYLDLTGKVVVQYTYTGWVLYHYSVSGPDNKGNEKFYDLFRRLCPPVVFDVGEKLHIVSFTPDGWIGSSMEIACLEHELELLLNGKRTLVEVKD